MKRFSLLLIVILLSLGSGVAQDWEFSLHFNSGLYSYSGASVKRSYLIFSDIGYADYTKTPFGSKNGVSYGIAGQVQRNTPSGFFYGIQSGLEVLRSRVDLYPGVTGCISMGDIDLGNTFLTNRVINFFPFAGKRFGFGSYIVMNLVLGTDLNWNFETFEFTRFNYDWNQQRKYRVFYDFENPADQIERNRTPIDIRPRIGITAYYKNFGLSLGYSHGITSYRDSMKDLRGEIYSRYVRMGFSYRFN